MARFRVTIETDRAKLTSRLGKKWTQTHIATWEKGVLVETIYNPVTKTISFSIWETGGSNKPKPRTLVKTFSL